MADKICLGPCPWGRAKPNLGKALNEITQSQKDWIAKAVISGTHKAHDIATRYGLRPGLVRNWVLRFKSNKELHTKAGQPVKISPAMIEKLDSMIKDKVLQPRPAKILKLWTDFLKTNSMQGFIRSQKRIKRSARGLCFKNQLTKTGLKATAR